VITYLLTRHLQPSQTFVTNELAELRRQGVPVDVVSLETGLVHDPSATYLSSLSPGKPGVLLANARLALRHPRRYLRFLQLVAAYRSEMGHAPDKVRWYLLPLLLPQLAARGTTRLHAHFAWSGAAAADLLSALTGLPWSVTLHANDIFSKQRNLARKLRDADLLVTVCRYNEDWMREHVGLTRDVAQVVCGVEVPERPWPSLNSPDVVTVGRLVEKKGVDTLLRAAALLRRTRPDLTVDVVGDGPLMGELTALVESLDLQGCVRMLGARDHEESLARIAGARVFALPCRIASDGDRDSMPLVVKEAMVRDVPCVGTDVAAVPEMLDDGCGLLVPPDDPEALAEALDRLLSDESLRQQVVARARARALERFTLHGEVSRLRALLVPDTVLAPPVERLS
jgi:glycosyltransferase involved in cell wall biosynthesis